MTLCPSARNEVGAVLLGVFSTGREVTWLPEPLPVDADSWEWLADEGGELRFRFAAECVTGRCARWKGRCEIGEGLADLATGSGDAPLPRCGIRGRCRWWSEQGERCCRLCPLVRTDVLSAPAEGCAGVKPD